MTMRSTFRKKSLYFSLFLSLFIIVNIYLLTRPVNIENPGKLDVAHLYYSAFVIRTKDALMKNMINPLCEKFTSSFKYKKLNIDELKKNTLKETSKIGNKAGIKDKIMDNAKSAAESIKKASKKINDYKSR